MGNWSSNDEHFVTFKILLVIFSFNGKIKSYKNLLRTAAIIIIVVVVVKKWDLLNDRAMIC